MIKKYSHSSNTVFSPNNTNYKDKNIKSLIRTFSEENTTNAQRGINRALVNSAINRNDTREMRRISNYFYSTNQIYLRFIEYLSNLNCFYWMVTPNMSYLDMIEDNSKQPSDDELKLQWWKVLDYVENINPEIIGPIITRKALLDGACYIAVKEKVTSKSPTSFGIQYLPIQYCRTTRRVGDRDVVDFNVKYFDDAFSTESKKKEALQVFPDCIVEEYFAYKAQKNKKTGDEWRTIDPEYAFRFALREDEIPFFLGIILDLLDLQDVKDITMFKLEQELSKIIVQKFDIDKDGQPTVDLNELQRFHNELSAMISQIPGIDAITTYGSIDAVDLQKQTETATNNPVKKSTENVYNGAGISEALFNADSSGTLSKSIVLDESMMYGIVKQICSFLNVRIRKNFQKGDFKKITFKAMMPEVTYLNRQEMSKMYKEQMSLGYSKFLPAITLGQKQSEIMASLIFENDILDAVSLMRPPASSNTTSATTLAAEEANKNKDTTKKKAGRPQLSEDEQTEKTEKNKESE